MLKKILITTGITLLLLLFGIWSYLLLFSSPKNIRDAFTNLVLQQPTERSIVYDTGTTTQQIPISAATLQQLTTRPIAGYIPISTASSSVVRYTERGTGHVYEINLNTGTETRILATTIVRVTNSFFSPNGQYVILESENDIYKEISLHKIEEGGVVSNELPTNSEDLLVLDSGIVYYTEITESETKAYKFDPLTESKELLWEIPLKDVKIYWTENGTFAVTDSAPNLKGSVYKILAGKIVAQTPSLYALTAKVNKPGNKILFTYYDIERRSFISKIKDLENNSTTNIPTVALSEKCDFFDTYNIWCAASFNLSSSDRDMVKKWYQGKLTSIDNLWQIHPDVEESLLRSVLSEEVGFTIDVEDLSVDPIGKKIFFANKIDNTLWMYRIPETTNELGTENETLTTDDGEPQTLEE